MFWLQSRQQSFTSDRTPLHTLMDVLFIQVLLLFWHTCFLDLCLSNGVQRQFLLHLWVLPRGNESQPPVGGEVKLLWWHCHKIIVLCPKEFFFTSFHHDAQTAEKTTRRVIQKPQLAIYLPLYPLSHLKKTTITTKKKHIYFSLQWVILLYTSAPTFAWMFNSKKLNSFHLYSVYAVGEHYMMTSLGHLRPGSDEKPKQTSQTCYL